MYVSSYYTDSGTSCVVLPDSLLSGVLRKKVLSLLALLVQKYKY